LTYVNAQYQRAQNEPIKGYECEIARQAGARRGENFHRRGAETQRGAGSVQHAGPTGTNVGEGRRTKVGEGRRTKVGEGRRTKVGEGRNLAQAPCRRAEMTHGCRIAREHAK
jgi:hypothetical protein